MFIGESQFLLHMCIVCETHTKECWNAIDISSTCTVCTALRNWAQHCELDSFPS